MQTELEVMTDSRDRAVATADALAAAIADHFGVKLGENGSPHCEWNEAYKIIANSRSPDHK